MRFRPVTSSRKMNKTQISKLNARETANVIAVATTTGPVRLERANMGTSVRPDMGTLVNGTETVESFLARGGSIKVGKPCKTVEPTVRCKGTRQTAKPFVMANTRNVSISSK